MKKGFTLIELLVVIAILAVLATAVVLVLNPAQLVKQGRDSTRISDVAAMNSALALYMSDVASIDLGNGTTAASTVGTSTCQGRVSVGSPAGFAASSTILVSTSTSVGNGSGANKGWIPVDFGAISSGSPLPKLPVDPNLSDGSLYAYCYRASGTVSYELNAKMESTKYGTGGSADVVSASKDGGNDDSWYEVGNGGL